MNNTLEKVINFVGLLQKFKTIERRVLVNNSDRLENDQEHSYSLAMLAWYINDAFDLKLNNEKILKYALAHDLVEVYAGDTYFFGNDDEKNSKHQREEDAAKQIKSEHPEFDDLNQIIEIYERKEDKESQFIYALDKLEPLLNIYLDKGRTWNKNNISYEQIVELKTPKVAGDETVKGLLKELLDKLKIEEKELFN